MSDRATPDLPVETKLTAPPVYDDIESFYPDVASYNKDREIEKVKTLLGELVSTVIWFFMFKEMGFEEIFTCILLCVFKC